MPPSLPDISLLLTPARIPSPSKWENPAPATTVVGSFGPGLCCPQAVILGTARGRGERKGAVIINRRINLGGTPGAEGLIASETASVINDRNGQSIPGHPAAPASLLYFLSQHLWILDMFMWHLPHYVNSVMIGLFTAVSPDLWRAPGTE